MKLMEEYRIPIKVRACDTMGYGVNYPGAVIPRSVQGIVYALHTHAGVPLPYEGSSLRNMITDLLLIKIRQLRDHRGIHPIQITLKLGIFKHHGL